MNLFDKLHYFKNISADPAYTEHSKRAILATEPMAMPVWSARRTIFRIIETGFAVALTGFFIFLITGGLSGSKFAPVQYSAIDPKTLHAEAEAIDIQIQLANVSYENPPAAESTAPLAAGTPKATSKRPAATVAPMAADATSTATSTEPMTLDEVLQSLSE